MTLDQVLTVVEKYESELKDESRQPERFVDGFPLKGAFPTREEALRHLLWMCGEIKNNVTQVKAVEGPSGYVGINPPGQMELQDEVTRTTEKVMRWLGFLQGVLWLAGAKSIDTMREDNRSPDGV